MKFIPVFDEQGPQGAGLPAVPVPALTGGDIQELLNNVDMTSVEVVNFLPTTNNFRGRTVFARSFNEFMTWTGVQWKKVAPDPIEFDVQELVDLVVASPNFSVISRVSVLPATGAYPGQVMYLTPESAFYFWNGTAWEPLITTPDLEGAIDTSDFAAGIRPILIRSVLPATGNPEDVVLLTTNGRLYRWFNGAWTDMVPATSVSGTLTNAQIQSIAAAKLTGSITETQISDGAISTPKIQAGAVSTAQLAAGSVVAEKIAAEAVTAAAIAAEAVTANAIASLSVNTNHLVANSVIAGKIAAAAINTVHLAAGAVVANSIAANAISAPKIAANAVTADKIAANAVTAEKIAANSINASKIEAAAVTAGKIAANAVTADKINVTSLSAISANLGSVVVQNANIANLSVDRLKIADGAVTDVWSSTSLGGITGTFAVNAEFSPTVQNCIITLADVVEADFIFIAASWESRGLANFTPSIAFNVRTLPTENGTWSDWVPAGNIGYSNSYVPNLDGTYPSFDWTPESFAFVHGEGAYRIQYRVTTRMIRSTNRTAAETSAPLVRSVRLKAMKVAK